MHQPSEVTPISHYTQLNYIVCLSLHVCFCLFMYVICACTTTEYDQVFMGFE